MSPPSPSPSWPPESAAEGGGGFGEIAFFDVETTVPSRPGAGFALLEFGAILVCPRRLVEVGCYSTLVRPSDVNSISATSQRCNGISRHAAAAAPSFSEVADRVFEVLHGRVWAGHNIVRFDCARIREAFAEIGRPAPEPKGMLDTLPLLTQRFGRRAGNMKMATLANYFGLGQQKHRSLDDVRMNLEVLKYCATVLFLESSLPDVFSIHSWASESPIMRNQANGSASPESAKPDLSPVPSLLSSPLMDPSTTLDVHDRAESSSLVRNEDTSDLVAHIEQMNIGPLDTTCGNGRSSPLSPDIRYITIAASEDNDCAGFLQADEVSVNCISVSQVPSHQNGCRLLLLHRDAPLQLCCPGLKVHFGISTKFVDNAGRPKLNIVVNIPANVHQVLGICDRLAQKSSTDSGSRSEWRPLIRNSGYLNSSCIRLHIPTIANGDMATYSTEIYKKEPSGNIEKLVFSKIDSAVLELLFVPGTIIDTCFSVDIYDYQQYAGIRLVAKRLVVHSS